MFQDFENGIAFTSSSIQADDYLILNSILHQFDTT